MNRKIILLLACLIAVLSGCSLNKTTENNDKVNDSNNSNESNVSSNWEDKVKDVEMKDVLLGYEVDGEYRGYLKLKLPVNGYLAAYSIDSSNSVNKGIPELDGFEKLYLAEISSKDFFTSVGGEIVEQSNYNSYEEVRDEVLSNKKQTSISDVSLKEGKLDGRRWFAMNWKSNDDDYELWIQLDNHIFFKGTWISFNNCIFSNDEIHEYFMDSITFVD